jgi:RNA polymerase sigma-70 factor (ECF subfamily)
MTNPSREARLVLRAQAGDRDALKIVLRDVQTPLLRYILGLVGRTAADDVVQEALWQICRNVKWLHQPELFRPWAYRIASRASFAFLKREKRWSKAGNQDVLSEELPAQLRPEPELFSSVPELLEQISPASRAVLLLHYVQELSIEETAAILDLSVGTAKSRLAYGLSCLRKLLER